MHTDAHSDAPRCLAGGICCSAMLYVPHSRPQLTRLSAPGVLSRPSPAPASNVNMSKAPSAPQPAGAPTGAGRESAKLGRFSAMARLQESLLFRGSGGQAMGNGSSAGTLPMSELPRPPAVSSFRLGNAQELGHLDF